MYRIAETLRVLVFMTLAILIFNFYPLTAVMIVILALLNDGAILSIAYDNVHYRNAHGLSGSIRSTQARVARDPPQADGLAYE
jgi:hypothetical protein